MIAEVELFFEKLKTAKDAILFIDYDGTIAPFAIERDKAFPHEGIIERLEALQIAGKTKVLIITGRTVKDLLKVLKCNPLPEIWGSHGGEHLLDGKLITLKNSLAAKGLSIATRMTFRNIDPSLCEKKRLGIAVHWRGLDEAQEKVFKQKALEIWQPLIQRYPLEILPFNGGIELRQKGISKAVAVNSVLEKFPFAIAAYIGDDFTDEQAFAAIGNRGLKILFSKEWKETLADMQLTNLHDLLSFLDKWLEYRSYD